MKTYAKIESYKISPRRIEVESAPEWMKISENETTYLLRHRRTYIDRKGEPATVLVYN